MSQDQMGQPQGERTQSEILSFGLSLPEGPITDNDIGQIETVIQQAVNKISESIKSQQKSVTGSDAQPIISGILTFKNWLIRQKCIRQVSIPYVEPSKYSDDFILNYIFLSYPGQIPINMVFNTGAEKTAEYRLLLFINPVDLLKFANFIEIKNIGGLS